MATPVAAEKARLDRLTRGPEPKGQARRRLIDIIENIVTHANERTAFYANADMHDIAEGWSELAVEADYRREAIEADTYAWGWVNA